MKGVGAMRRLVATGMNCRVKIPILMVFLVGALPLVATPSFGGCGCMDLALIIDDTGSMGPAIDNVKAELPDIIATA
jgi:hypothetical protein